MEKIANQDLPSFSDRVYAEVVAAIQAELKATIDDLANAVCHLARVTLRAKHAVVIDDTKDVETALATELAAVWAAKKEEPEL